MSRIARRFESVINNTLLIIMSLVVVLTTIDLGWKLVENLSAPPYFRLSEEGIREVFSSFLLVLIGLELLDTVRAYMTEKAIHVELVISVGLVAVTRKILLIDMKSLDAVLLIGIAAIIVALAASYYVVTIARRRAAPSPKT